MKTITVDVTAEDIEKGRKTDCESCPVALAIGRAVRPDAWVWVSHHNLLIDGFHAFVPDEVERFITSFDLSQPVEPFRFDLEIPDDIPIIDAAPAAHERGGDTA